ncbi:MAG: hypothetical protein HS115_18335 [Spirochaetales bacterium]|nr:hypothetical protein [Spirochaetales bacterium]
MLKSADRNTPGNDWILALILTGIALAGRLLPHPANITPVAAAGILAFTLLDRSWLALMVPAVALLVSNLFLPFEHVGTMALINLGFFLPAFLGIPLKKVLAGGPYLQSGLKAGVTSAIIFYLLSNLGVFLWGGLYPFSLEGLLSCYTMALPFLLRSAAGDVFFVLTFLFLARSVLAYQSRVAGTGSQSV